MDETEGQTADTSYGTSATANGPPTEAQATGIAQSFATEFSGYDSGAVGDAAAVGVPPSATGSSVPANSTGAKANDVDGFSKGFAAVETSATEVINTVINTIMAILGLASGPVGAIRGGQALYNMAQSGAYGRLGSAPGTTSTGRGAIAASSSFTGGFGTSERGDSGVSSPVIGWGGVMANAPAAPKAVALPFIAAKPQGPAKFAGPSIATAPGGSSGAGQSLAPLVVGGAILLLLV